MYKYIFSNIQNSVNLGIKSFPNTYILSHMLLQRDETSCHSIPRITHGSLYGHAYIALSVKLHCVKRHHLSVTLFKSLRYTHIAALTGEQTHKILH